jgi:hypothetical protein
MTPRRLKRHTMGQAVAGLQRVDGMLRQETKENMFPPLSIPPGDIRPPKGCD